MTRSFEVHIPVEQGYIRDALFGIELLDAVTLDRVSAGVKVVAKGLRGKPVVNASGLFGWFREDLSALEKVTIDPGVLPYERVELQPSDLNIPLTVVQLAPRVDYPFAAGVTGLRGVLIESRVVPAVPVRDAVVHLRWLDDDSVWQDAPTAVRTDTKGGDFAVFLRLSPSEEPFVAQGDDRVTVRLAARRGASERESADLKLPQGRIADPSSFDEDHPEALIFAWDELQP